jgi:hypothetical protein
MSDTIDKEVGAIKVVLEALESLDDDARSNVLTYVMKRLRIHTASPFTQAQPAAEKDQALEVATTLVQTVDEPVHIEKFKEEKKPRSANEMAALVAYYLANLAPQGQRKATVNTDDIETYFKIAKFPLPEQIRVTLQNARNAGYLDTAGEGEYKLNAVGHNLVVHSMPRGAGSASRASRAKRSKVKRKPTRSR